MVRYGNKNQTTIHALNLVIYEYKFVSSIII